MEYKETPEVYASSPKGLQRLGKLKWWFIALLALGVAIAIVVLVSAIEPASVEFQKLGFFFISEAFAQTGGTVRSIRSQADCDDGYYWGTARRPLRKRVDDASFSERQHHSSGQ